MRGKGRLIEIFEKIQPFKLRSMVAFEIFRCLTADDLALKIKTSLFFGGKVQFDFMRHVLLLLDPKTQASFVFFSQKFCRNSAKLLKF